MPSHMHPERDIVQHTKLITTHPERKSEGRNKYESHNTI
jgi:hypothetical protein